MITDRLWTDKKRQSPEGWQELLGIGRKRGDAQKAIASAIVTLTNAGVPRGSDRPFLAPDLVIWGTK